MNSRTNSQIEYDIQCNIAQYLRLQYPAVVFRSDLGGINLTIGQAVKVKRLQAGRAFPDMFLAEPRNGYHGLFGEIKAEAGEVFTKAGTMRQSEHIQEQWQMIRALRDLGYCADFWLGFEDAKDKIDRYLNGTS